jgi:hypothetical protein
MRAYLILAILFFSCATPEPKIPQVPTTEPAAPEPSQPAPERMVLMVNITESPTDGPIHKAVREVLEVGCCEVLTATDILRRRQKQDDDAWISRYPNEYTVEDALGLSFRFGVSFVVEGSLSQDDPPLLELYVLDAGTGRLFWSNKLPIEGTATQTAQILAAQILEGLILKTKPCPRCAVYENNKLSIVISSKSGALSDKVMDALIKDLPKKVGGISKIRLVESSAREATLEVLFYSDTATLGRTLKGFFSSRVTQITKEQVSLELE